MHIRSTGVIFFSTLLLLLITGCYQGNTYAPILPATETSAPPTQEAPTAAISEDPVDIQLAWFYKPPDDDQLDLLPKYFDFFILTHKDEDQRQTLQEMGLQTPVYQYLLLFEIQDPGSCFDRPFGNQIAYLQGDFCQISEEHPDWFLLDRAGKRIENDGYYHMDPGNEEFRQFWVERALEMQTRFGWEGIFLDNAEASLNKLRRWNVSAARYPTDEHYQTAVNDFLIYIRQNISAPVYANIIELPLDTGIWHVYMESLDGAMIEDFAVDWDYGYIAPPKWESQLQLIEATTANHKTVILVAQGDKFDTPRQVFAMASYLLVANDNIFFRYTNADYYHEIWLYDNYLLDLGYPLAARYHDGQVWWRDFSNGSVWVDPYNNTAEINFETNEQ